LFERKKIPDLYSSIMGMDDLHHNAADLHSMTTRSLVWFIYGDIEAFKKSNVLKRKVFING